MRNGRRIGRYLTVLAFGYSESATVCSIMDVCMLHFSSVVFKAGQ